MQIQAKNFPVAILGVGTMGEGIAQTLASAGHPVFLYDISEMKIREAVEKIDSETQNLYQEIRDLYVRNNDRFRGVYWDKATGFESFAWYLMLSDETRKRFR